MFYLLFVLLIGLAIALLIGLCASFLTMFLGTHRQNPLGSTDAFVESQTSAAAMIGRPSAEELRKHSSRGTIRLLEEIDDIEDSNQE